MEGHEGHDHDAHDDHDHGDEDSEFATLSSEAAEESKLPWGQVIGATLLVNLAALSGCLIIVFAAVQRGLLKARGQDTSATGLVGQGKFFDLCIPAFAVGALIATAVFLIFPEALHLIEGECGLL